MKQLHPRPLHPEPRSVRRILVLQQRQIGDVLLATPGIRMLKERFPQAEIHVFTEERCEPVLRHNPDIAKIWALDKTTRKSPLKSLAFYKKITAKGFDMVVDFQQLPRTRMLSAMSRAKYRLTSAPRWYTRPVYTHFTPTPKGYAGAVKTAALHPLGLTWSGEKPVLVLTDEEMATADTLLREAGLAKDDILVTVDATHKHASHRWPAESYAEVIAMAVQKDPRIKFLLLAAPGEESTVQQIAVRAETSNCLTPIIHDLRMVAAVIHRADLHFGHCSAPRHMAAALDTPSLVIPGASSDGWRYPDPMHEDLAPVLGCRPCRDADCEHLRCLKEISPAMAYERLLFLLEKNAGFGKVLKEQ
jgi:ADP-heptose:LPS heptosyltransferase